MQPLPGHAQKPGQLGLGSVSAHMGADLADQLVPERRFPARAQREAATRPAARRLARPGSFTLAGRGGAGRGDEFVDIGGLDAESGLAKGRHG